MWSIIIKHQANIHDELYCRKRKQRKKEWVQWGYEQIWWEEGKTKEKNVFLFLFLLLLFIVTGAWTGHGPHGKWRLPGIYPTYQLLQQFEKLGTKTFDHLWRCKLVRSCIGSNWQQQLVLSNTQEACSCVFKIFFWHIVLDWNAFRGTI